MIPSYVYIDGFNLYYGAVKGTAYKWLDLARLVQLLLPKNQILKIKYLISEFKKDVIVLNPSPARPSHELAKYAAFVKPIRQGVLASSQFPQVLQDPNGFFSKPQTW